MTKKKIRQRRQERPVDRKESAVVTAYDLAARKLDVKYHGCPLQPSAGAAGPVKCELGKYPPVRGLVFGAFTEVSSNVVVLCDEVARMAAERHWRMMGSRSPQEARDHIAYHIRGRWAMTAARGHAQVRILRMRRVLRGLPGGDPGLAEDALLGDDDDADRYDATWGAPFVAPPGPTLPGVETDG